MKAIFGILTFGLLAAVSFGFFVPFTNAEKVKLADMIVIGTIALPDTPAHVELHLENTLKGKATEKKLPIYIGHDLNGRNPDFTAGRYLIFLAKDEVGRWCVLQSLFDAFRIERETVVAWKDDGETTSKSVPLAEVVEKINKLLVQK